MGLCKDCKHWDHPNEKYWGGCVLTRSNTLSEDPRSLALAYGYDDDMSAALMCPAELATAPDFGCNQFEAKE